MSLLAGLLPVLLSGLFSGALPDLLTGLLSGIDLEALWLSVQLAALTTAILVALAVPLAAWLVLGRGRIGTLRIGPLVEAVAMVPLVLPPTVLGFYLLVLLGPRTGFGRMLIHLLGHPLTFSFAGLVVGSVIYSLPFALQPLTAGFSQVRPELLEAAELLGASRLRTLRTVVLPLAKRALLASAVLSFAHTVGEFGVVLMIGGDIPGRTRTLSIALLDQVQDFRYDQANHTALLLLAASVSALTLLYATGAAGAGTAGARPELLPAPGKDLKP